jgi:hypothetical protein
MPTAVMVYDETPAGERSEGLKLEFVTARITARDLIRKRVYEEVREYNMREPDTFRGLVEPTGAERLLNGYKVKQRRKIDWERQARIAEEAFERNGFFMLVDDRQVEALDDPIDLRLGTEVSFVKLMPLMGG